jgi:hypothetical protein
MECKVGDVVMPGCIIQEADALAKESKKVVLGTSNTFHRKCEVN